MFIFLFFLLASSINIELKREILKEGFHRELLTSIKFDKDVSNCKIFIQENFSKNIYLSINELEDKRRYNQRNNLQIIVIDYHNKTFDVEKPSFQSQDQTVTFSTVLTKNFIEISIPFHFRYQKPSKKVLYRPVIIYDPVSMTLQCENYNETLKWEILKPLIEEVPVGDLNDLELVKYGTILITLISSILILINSY